MPKVKRLNKMIHPNSRQAMEIAAKEHHHSRLARAKEDTKNRVHLLSRKLLWFQAQVKGAGETGEVEMNEEAAPSSETAEPVKQAYTMEEIRALIELYFHRFDDELDQIRTKNSIGKRSLGQHFSREKSIEMTLQAEKNEYESVGIVVPDLTNANNVKIFRNWIGDANSLQTIKLKTVRKA